jgi:hypothetical protein
MYRHEGLSISRDFLRFCGSTIGRGPQCADDLAVDACLGRGTCSCVWRAMPRRRRTGGGERVDDDEHEYEDERYSCSAIRTQGKSIFFLWATLMNGQKRQVKMAEIAKIDLRSLFTE